MRFRIYRNWFIRAYAFPKLLFIASYSCRGILKDFTLFPKASCHCLCSSYTVIQVSSYLYVEVLSQSLDSDGIPLEISLINHMSDFMGGIEILAAQDDEVDTLLAAQVLLGSGTDMQNFRRLTGIEQGVGNSLHGSGCLLSFNMRGNTFDAVYQLLIDDAFHCDYFHIHNFGELIPELSDRMWQRSPSSFCRSLSL